MKLINRAIDNLEDLLAYFARFMAGKDLAAYSDLATAAALSDEERKEFPDVVDPHVLITKHNSMLTVFDVQGTFRIFSEDEYQTMLSNLQSKIGSYMRSPGHSVSFCLERDPDRAHDELMRLAEPQFRTAKRLGLAVDDVIMSRVDRNTPLVAWEQNLLMVYTHLPVMTPEELKRVIAERGKDARSADVPLMDFAQHPALYLSALRYRHDSFVERVKDDFLKCGPNGDAGVLLTRMSAHDAARAVRIQVDREHTSHAWRPRLPGDRIRASGQTGTRDHSELAHPNLNYQICTHPVETTRRGLLVTQNLHHAAISMELGPLEPRPFRDLMMSINRAMPWRIRFDLEPGGLRKSRGRRTLLSMVGMFPGNSLIRDTFQLLERVDRDDPVCTLRVVATTWAPDEKKALERAAALEKAMQAWGVCNMRSAAGADPMEVFASGVAGFSASTIANEMFPPLSYALNMFPLQRPATPWANDGSMVQRTPEGKIYPVGIASRLQDTDITVVSAPPGSGKSMFGNVRACAICLRAGLRRLPRMLIVDVGYSSEGLISMLRESLPADRHGEVLAIRLTNDPKFAVNFLDIQLGANGPTRFESEFMEDMVSAFLMDTVTLSPPSSDAGRLASSLVKAVFRMKMKDEPARFESGVEDEIDRTLRETGLWEEKGENWWGEATWMEVRDLLFATGRTQLANLAHLRAMPALPDLGAVLQSPTIKQQYKSARCNNGEGLLDYAARAFTAAAEQYPLLASKTRYMLGSETRVLAIDLQNVIGSKTNEGKLKTSMMYLFARHLGARNFFLDEAELLEVLPASRLYHDYHLARVADVKDEQKFIQYDELHNIGYKRNDTRSNQLTIVADRMEKDGREMRKWGVSITGISQYLEDYPEMLLNAASSVFVMRGGHASDAQTLQTNWRVSDECIRQLNQLCTGPGPQGVNYLAMFKTRLGTITQILTNTVGAQELWAFSTTPSDTALRGRLVKEIGAVAARRLLAKHFKTGTAEKAIDRMKAEMADTDDGSVLERLSKRLLDDYRATALEDLGEAA